MTDYHPRAKELISKYYSSTLIEVPAVSMREFGFGFVDKIDYRHKSFSSDRELRDFLKIEAPKYASYSTARYSLPSGRPMSKKGYLGGDLVFDIDKTYGEEHEKKHNPLACRLCFERSREDAARFVEEFLCKDYGFSRSEVSVNFSGNKGFHFHVRSDAVQQLSSNSRKQLCDYAGAFEVSGEKLIKPAGGVKNAVVEGPSLSSGGWAAKVLRHCAGIIENATAESFEGSGLRKERVTEILSKKAALVASMERGKWGLVSGMEAFFHHKSDDFICKTRVDLDKPVSFDLARLIRIPGTIHGSSGFVAKTIQNLDKFSPLEDALAFDSGETEVTILQDCLFEMEGLSRFYKAGERPTVSLSVALFLYLKGLAQ